MEAIAAAKLSKLAEEASLLLAIQIRFRKGRSTEIALFFLTPQVEQVWKTSIVVSLLSLDISEAYDRVLPEILQQTLERKSIPLWLTFWTTPSAPITLLLLFLMTLNLLLFLFIVVFLKTLLSPLFFSCFTSLNCMKLFTASLLVFLPWVLQIIQICLLSVTPSKATFSS